MSLSERTIATPASEIPAPIKRNTVILAGAQGSGWLITQAVAVLSGITADNLTGDRRWAGIPITLFILASALTAPIAGRKMDVVGRKPVLMFGFLALFAGLILTGLSIAWGSLIGFLAGNTIIGVGNACTMLSRSAAADMYPPSRRAWGLGIVISGAAVGAVLGPFILRELAEWGRSVGLDPSVTPWLGIAPVAVLALAVLFFINPDPSKIAQNLANYYPQLDLPSATLSKPARPLMAILRQFPVAVAIATTTLIQAGMVMLMVTVALSMKDHGHEGAIAGVMASHFLGMLGFSMFIGKMADMLGRRSVILVGALIFIAGATTAPLINDPLLNGVSLFLVGVGWSFSYVAGNTILADMAQPNERGSLLGANDFIVGVSGAVASLVSGLILGGAGFLAVGTVGLVLGLIPLLLAFKLSEPSPGHYATASDSSR